MSQIHDYCASRGGVDITATAGEALLIRDCVFIMPNSSVGTAGQAYKADADTVRQSSSGYVIGFAYAAISAGSGGKIRIAGVLGGFSGLTPGAPQYVSTTAGEITETEPTNSVLIGMAISTTEILINTRGAQTAIVSNGTKGYWAGGNTGASVKTADKCTFATQTMAACTTAQLSAIRHYVRGLNEGNTKGYVFGGASGADVYQTTSDKVTFATDSTAAIANMTAARGRYTAVNNGSIVGYLAGGITVNGGVGVLTADKITYSSDSQAANTTAVLNVAVYEQTGVSEGVTKGYSLGGFTATNYTAAAEKLTFSSETYATMTSANLSQARRLVDNIVSRIKGYVAGGYTGAYVQTGDVVTFSTDTTAADTNTKLSVAKGCCAGTSEGSIFGIWSGGFTGTYNAVSNKLTFATDTNAAATTMNISQARGYLAAVSDMGW